MLQISLFPPSPRFLRRSVSPAAVALVVLLGACSTPPPPEPVTAGDAIVALAESGQPQEVAECIVGLLSDRIAPADLVSGAELAANDQLRLEEATANCELASELLNTDTTPPDDLAFDLTPQIYGDDPVLDQLWDACEAGIGEACDNLWREAPIGSAYERFGVTCGERFEILNCSEDMDAADSDTSDESEQQR